MTEHEQRLLEQFERLPAHIQKRVAEKMTDIADDKYLEILKSWYAKVLTLANEMWWETPPNDIRRAYDRMAQKYPNVYMTILEHISVNKRNKIMYELREQYYVPKKTGNNAY